MSEAENYATTREREFASWPWVVYINVPIALVIHIFMWKALPGGKVGARFAAVTPEG